MIYDTSVAGKVAQKLMEIKAVKLQPADPFTWASGLRSPIYCDNRKTLSFPGVRNLLKQSFADIVRNKFPGAEAISGVATAGIAHGALLADELDLPFNYVRSKAKGHGLQNQIEGIAEPGQKVVVVEDLISTGGSSLDAVSALRDAGCEILGLVAIFTYGFQKAEDNFKAANCTYYTLSDYPSLISHAQNSGQLKDWDIDSLRQWYQDPNGWSAANG